MVYGAQGLPPENPQETGEGMGKLCRPGTFLAEGRFRTGEIEYELPESAVQSVEQRQKDE